MYRPCILVVDREFPGAISTRKLLLETARFNVITAYSGAEAIQTLKRFPKVDAIVMDEEFRDMDCKELATQLKQIAPKVPILATTADGTSACPYIDSTLHSYNPARLVDAVRQFFPESAAAIFDHEKKLAEE